jgi:nicotinate-nucleotide pyrophosphorylase (carboxylating)
MAKKEIRDLIFSGIEGERYLADISVQEGGILSGVRQLRSVCKTLGIRVRRCKNEGERIRPSDTVATIEGTAKQIARGEEELIGWISKSSGIATAAWRAKRLGGKKLKVVSGAWKKMPSPLKESVRQAVASGGISYRISQIPLIYLDKNYVKILGGVMAAVLSVKKLQIPNIIVQLKSKGRTLLEESTFAARNGAKIIMIDTGRREDIRKVDLILRKKGLRKNVKIAFGGNIQLEDLKEMKKMPVEIVDIGKSIVDAPLLNMRMDVIKRV